jgi:RNA polymerase sigma-70 factor, ECF subfamily
MLTLTDEELVLRCKKELPHNTGSYELLVQRYMNKVYNIVLHLIADREEAQDITQEVFVKVYNNLKKFEERAAFSTWLYRIAHNTALDAIEKNKRRPVAVKPKVPSLDQNEPDDILARQPALGGDPEELATRNELRECIGKVLKQMKPDQSSILLMRDFEDASYEEIAAEQKAGLSAIKMRIHRARMTFQEIFMQFCGSIHLGFAAAGTPEKPERKGSK